MIDAIIGIIVPIPVRSIWRKLRNTQNTTNSQIESNGWINTERDENENTVYDSDGKRVQQ